MDSLVQLEALRGTRLDWKLLSIFLIFVPNDLFRLQPDIVQIKAATQQGEKASIIAQKACQY